MGGCLPLSFQRLLNPHKPRPYLPADEPVAIKTTVPRSQRTAHSRPSQGSGITSVDAGRRERPYRPSASTGAQDNAQRRREEFESRLPGRSLGPAVTPHQLQPQPQPQQRTNNTNKKHPPSRIRGESRPTGLFAGVQPPLAQSDTTTSQHQPGAAIDQRTPPSSVLGRDQRSRHHAINVQYHDPSWQPPRGWIVTSAGGQATRSGPSQPPRVHTMPSRETLSRSVSPLSSSVVSRAPDAAVLASLVELPGSYTDFMEKEAVVAPSVRTMASYDTFDTSPQPPSSGRPSQLDSVIELPGSIPKKPFSRDSLVMAELPGSSPMIMEKDAGPLPPAELPASVPERSFGPMSVM